MDFIVCLDKQNRSEDSTETKTKQGTFWGGYLVPFYNNSICSFETFPGYKKMYSL